MKDPAFESDHADDDILAVQFTDEELEAATTTGSPQCFPTFTCSVPMCATGGGCGTWPGGVN